MIAEIKNIKNEKSDYRNFGITVGLVLIAIGGYLFWRGRESFGILLVSGTMLLLLGLVVPVVLKPIYWPWMVLAIILGWIMARVILSLFFYVVITPIALLSRLFGKSFLHLKWNKSKDTYWNFRIPDQRNPEDLENQF